MNLAQVATVVSLTAGSVSSGSDFKTDIMYSPTYLPQQIAVAACPIGATHRPLPPPHFML